MKRWFAALFLLCLLPACASGAAVFSSLDILRGDGTRATLRVQGRQGEAARWKNDYTLLETGPDGKPIERAFPGEPYLLTRLDVGFAGGCMTADGRHQIALYDEHAAPLLQIDVPRDSAYVQAYVRSGGALCLLVRSWAVESDRGFSLLRIEENRLIHHLSFDEDDYLLYALLAGAQGSVLLTGSHEEDYRRHLVLCVGAQGDVLWERILSAPNAAVRPRLTRQNEDGTLTLYGSCIAAPRDLYTVFAMTLDTDGRVLSLDVRDMRIEGAVTDDTEPDFSLSWDGSALVEMLVTRQKEITKAVALFSDLPQASSAPAITFRQHHEGGSSK